MTTHKERIQACLENQIPDRPPVALWRHVPVDDQDPKLLADATLNFQRTYDCDLVKVTPASSFCVKDWGVEDQWMGDTEGTRPERDRSSPGRGLRTRFVDPGTRAVIRVRCRSRRRRRDDR